MPPFVSQAQDTFGVFCSHLTEPAEVHPNVSSPASLKQRGLPEQKSQDTDQKGWYKPAKWKTPQGERRIISVISALLPSLMGIPKYIVPGLTYTKVFCPTLYKPTKNGFSK